MKQCKHTCISPCKHSCCWDKNFTNSWKPQQSKLPEEINSSLYLRDTDAKGWDEFIVLVNGLIVNQNALIRYLKERENER